MAFVVFIALYDVTALTTFFKEKTRVLSKLLGIFHFVRVYLLNLPLDFKANMVYE